MVPFKFSRDPAMSCLVGVALCSCNSFYFA